VHGRALALSILLVASGCSANSSAPTQPEDQRQRVAHLPARPSGPILDQADVLNDADEAALDERLRNLWQKDGTALVVVSVKSLDGQPIERYANQLARAWDVGDVKTHRGVLLLVAPRERQVRIEVACGSEAQVSDVAAGRIIREIMVPAYKTGNIAHGTIAGADALIDRLTHRRPASDLDSKHPGCSPDMKEAA
jgi:uncharacterized protein